jgi:hypothetical protein
VSIAVAGIHRQWSVQVFGGMSSPELMLEVDDSSDAVHSASINDDLLESPRASLTGSTVRWIPSHATSNSSLSSYDMPPSPRIPSIRDADESLGNIAEGHLLSGDLSSWTSTTTTTTTAASSSSNNNNNGVPTARASSVVASSAHVYGAPHTSMPMWGQQSTAFRYVMVLCAFCITVGFDFCYFIPSALQLPLEQVCCCASVPRDERMLVLMQSFDIANRLYGYRHSSTRLPTPSRSYRSSSFRSLLVVWRMLLVTGLLFGLLFGLLYIARLIVVVWLCSEHWQSFLAFA